MKTVYVVTTGSYSDYSVSCVFEDKALADAHAVDVDGSVEEFQLLDEAPVRFTVYSISNDTFQGRGVTHEWTYLAWSYNRGQYKRAERTEWGNGSIRVVGWDRAAVRKSYHDATARLQAKREVVA